MVEIAPAVLSETPEDYAHDLKRATDLSNRIQIDLADGRFASNRTVNPPQAYWPEGVRADMHMMYQYPFEHVPTFIAMQPHMVIFHAEAQGLDDAGLEEACRQLQSVGIKTGLALLPETGVDQASDYLELVDHVLIFTGELGHYGGQMRSDCLPKIAAAKDIKPGIEAGVDGGINDTNAAEVVAAGAEVLNVGGYLQNADDPQDAYAKLETVITTKS